ncbi:hypothetical protein Tco_0458400 [Tanacetum coccineum]
MRELTFFLGLQVQQKEEGIFISQDKYVAEILKKFDFTTVKTASTPMKPNKVMVKDEEADSVDVYLYRSMIGSLMYLTASRPDITFAVCACARFQVTPKTSHFHAVKKIFRYLKGQPKLGLWYPRDSPFDLEAYSDSDYAGASIDMNSTTGGCQFLGKRLISWQCKKQTIVANSTTEAEYVTAVNCCGQSNPLNPPSTAPPEVLSQVTTVAASQPPKDPNTYRRTKRGQNTKVPQSGGSPNKVGDEAINEEMFDSVERAATTASSLEAEQASGNINKTQFTTTLNEPSFLELGSGSGPWRQETMGGGGMQAQTRSKGVSNLSSDPPLSGGHTLRSGEDSMEHQIELTNNVPNTPHDSPLPGVNTPGSDEGSLELNELMDLVTKLSHKVFDLEKVKTAQAKEIAGLKRRVTKLEQRQRSRILKNHPFRFGSFRRQSLGRIDADDTEVVKGSGDTEVLDTKKAVNTAGEGVSTASVSETVSTAAERTPPTTTTVFDDEDVTMAMAQTLIKMKEEKAKEKGVVIKNVEDSSRPVKSISTLQPLPTIDPKDKVALRLQAELDEEIRVERERQEEASKVAIAEMFDEKQLADERAAAIRNKPPTKIQLRNLMMTYLKNMGGYKHSQLKGKSYEEIQGLYERQQTRIQDFTPMDSEKEAQKPGKKLKRVAGSYATQKSPKKPKVMKYAKDVIEKEASEYEKEKEELRLRLKIISNDDSEVDYEPLSRKFPIVYWEYQLLRKMEAKDMYVYKLTRADGSSSYHRDTQGFLRRIDRKYLNDLYRLVQERFQDHPLEGHDFCGVHTLFMDGTPVEINMLVEKKYPMIKELLEKMPNLQLKAEEESTMAFELIKFIKSLLEE